MSKKRFWTTMEELRDSPAVEKLRHEEFKSKPQEYFDAQSEGGLKFGRRDFLKWSTGALALASTACARKPVQEIVPYAQQPPSVTVGDPNFYASTCQECSAGCGIVLKTYSGRPVKVEGNPLHPINRGALCARGQASLLDLYDPDRLRYPVGLQRVHTLKGVVENKPQPVYNAHFPTNVWDTGESIRKDQHRITRPLKKLSWKAVESQVTAWFNGAGSRAVVLTGTIHGPARTALLADFLSVFPARHVVYDAMNPDAEVRAMQAVYGAAKGSSQTLNRYFYDRAEMVVTFGSDPLGAGVSPVEYGYGFGRQRKMRGNTMSRVVSFEPAMSLIGLSADSRFLVPPSQLLPLAMALAHQLVIVDKQSKFAGNPAVVKALEAFQPDVVERQAGLKPGVLAQIAAELWDRRGKGIVSGGGLAGATADRAMLESVVAFLNSALENEGATVDGTGSPSLQAQGSDAAMLQLIDDMNQGKVDTLLVYGTNPAYTLPDAADFLPALAKVPHVVVLSDRLDETAQLGDLALPALHGMERWGDAEPQVGLYSIVQPTIEPLFDGRSFEDFLISVAYPTPAGKTKFTAPPPPKAATLPPAPGSALALPLPGAGKSSAGAAAKAAAAPPAPPPPPATAVSFYQYLRNYWQTQIYAKNNVAGSFDDFWTGMLQQCVFDPNPQRLQPGPARTFNTAALAALPSAPAASPAQTGELELAMAVNCMQGDGSRANNAFLQEIPDPVWKSCWDNFFVIAPSTAKALNLAEDDQRYAIAEATINGRTLRAPVYVQYGVHPGVVSIDVGYGRASCGEVGTGVGVNAYSVAPLASGAQPGFIYAGVPVSLKRVGGGYLIASPQSNNYADFGDNNVTGEYGRSEQIVRDTTLVQIQSNPAAGNPPQEPPESIWDNGGPSEHQYPDYHWGMTIDMNACIGCNACVAACYQENNVPVVGKDQVWRGREMAWLRIDRYFSGDEQNPDVTMQPMLCQQCANAGCESVCPVIATVTDSEGLNVQIYNRCVGTRFCSNNCIYKVRRFNFYQFSRVRASPLELALNPMVTVRSKGIMEKCTFCVQRIHSGHYHAKELGVPVKDGDILTACQQTCPTEAIYFGNMDDKDSKMMQARTARGYKVLEAMNYQPSITYLTKVRNLGRGSAQGEDKA